MAGWCEEITHRQMSCFRSWLGLQWNIPDRTDHYLMRVCQVAAELMGNKNVDLNSFKIKFNRTYETGSTKGIESTPETSKAVWSAFLGGYGTGPESNTGQP